MKIIRHPFLIICAVLLLAGLVISCGQSYTEGDYDVAYQEGYEDGWEDGYEKGYLDGYEHGWEEGYFDGYGDGWEDASSAEW